MKKLIITALILMMPIGAWAIPTTYNFVNSGSSMWNVVHDSNNNNDRWDFGFDGSITGDWSGSVLSGITGSLLSNNGQVSIQITDGQLNPNGTGNWLVNISRGARTYMGTFNFQLMPPYSLFVNENFLKIWGDANLSCTKSDGSNCRNKWLGLDAKGPGSSVPGPAPFAIMGIGLIALISFGKFKSSLNPSKSVRTELNTLLQPQIT